MGQYFPGYATGGLEWVSNLAVPDPTYILPVIACSTMVVSILELGQGVTVHSEALYGRGAA